MCDTVPVIASGMAAVRPARERRRRLRAVPPHPGRRSRGRRWLRGRRRRGGRGRRPRPGYRRRRPSGRVPRRRRRGPVPHVPRRRWLGSSRAGPRTSPAARLGAAWAPALGALCCGWRLALAIVAATRSPIRRPVGGRRRLGTVRARAVVDAPPARLVPPGHAPCSSPSPARLRGALRSLWLLRTLGRPSSAGAGGGSIPRRAVTVIELPLLVELSASGDPRRQRRRRGRLVHAGTGYAAHRLRGAPWIATARLPARPTGSRSGAVRRSSASGGGRTASRGRRPLSRVASASATSGRTPSVALRPRDPAGRAGALVGACASGPLFALWNPPVGVVLMVAYGVVVNAPFIAIQRYNRARAERLLARARIPLILVGPADARRSRGSEAEPIGRRGAGGRAAAACRRARRPSGGGRRVRRAQPARGTRRSAGRHGQRAGGCTPRGRTGSAAPYAVTPAATHHSGASPRERQQEQSRRRRAEKHSGNRSLRSKRPGTRHVVAAVPADPEAVHHPAVRGVADAPPSRRTRRNEEGRRPHARHVHWLDAAAPFDGPGGPT